ncbi:MAG: DUF4105 domain-containing protein [Pseudomonadota bacterium]
MGWLIRTILFAVIAVICAIAAAWGAMALWFHLTFPEFARLAAAVVFALLGVIAVGDLLRGRLRWPLALFGVAIAGIFVWWNGLVPPSEGNWAAEVARQTTGDIEGDTLTLYDARAFRWRTDTDFDEVWETQTYDLSEITSLDLFMSYWAGPHMAHMMVSFGFADGRYLNWTAEVRRQADGEFSPVADFFNTNPIVLIAGEERDILGLRTFARDGETVHLFRLRGDPAGLRPFLEAYVARANALAAKPEFFNSLFSNCSMTVLNLARAVGVQFPLDWRLLVNGYLPNFLYDRDTLPNTIPLQDYYDLGVINDRARAEGPTDAFSDAIRVGVP